MSSVMKGNEWDWKPARFENVGEIIQSKLPLVKIGASDINLFRLSQSLASTEVGRQSERNKHGLNGGSWCRFPMLSYYV